MRPIPIAQYLNQQGRGVSAARAPVFEAAPQLQAQPQPQPRSMPSAAELEAQIDQAFAKARQEGLASARIELEAALAKDKAERDERELADRLSFRATEYAKLSNRIGEGLKEIESRIADSVARILKPYVNELQQRQIEQALIDQIKSLLSAGSPDIIKITGPKEKLDLMAQKLAPYAVSVDYAVQEGVDVKVVAQHSVFETQMSDFMTALNALFD